MASDTENPFEELPGLFEAYARQQLLNLALYAVIKRNGGELDVTDEEMNAAREEISGIGVIHPKEGVMTLTSVDNETHDAFLESLDQEHH